MLGGKKPVKRPPNRLAMVLIQVVQGISYEHEVQRPWGRRDKYPECVLRWSWWWLGRRMRGWPGVSVGS